MVKSVYDCIALYRKPIYQPTYKALIAILKRKAEQLSCGAYNNRNMLNFINTETKVQASGIYLGLLLCLF
jgi:hypothetical protein